MWPFDEAYPEVAIRDLLPSYDYVIVGGGTAGCVLANRLSASPSTRVLLIEAGPVADSWASRVPLLSSDFASDGTRTWTRPSALEGNMGPGEEGRSIPLVTGRALGGSSRINQMLYTRGLPGEWESWRGKGREGWGWEEVRPYFTKGETVVDYDGTVDAEVHGTSGEWRNTTIRAPHYASAQRVLAASRDIGLPWISDVNDPSHPTKGIARLHYTRTPTTRHSTYHAFLPHELVVKRKANLHVCTNALVERLVFDESATGEGLKVKEVLITPATQQLEQTRTAVSVDKEVILCAGPFGSPQVLMLSGIGPKEHLQEHNIPVRKHLPAVGSNLQDHLGVSLGYTVPVSDSLIALEKRPWMFIIELFKYLIWGTGVLLAPVVQLAVFAWSGALDARGAPKPQEKESEEEKEVLPDFEIMPMSYDSGDQPFSKSRGRFSFLCVLLRPESKGAVRLSTPSSSRSSSTPSLAKLSPSIHTPLHIALNYLSAPADFAPLRAALRLSLRIVERIRASDPSYPLEDWYVPASESDADLDAFISAPVASTYHYASTCRMAPEDDAAGGGVVDARLRVHGTCNVRVADSSVFPWIPGTHLQAGTVMIAERCADFVLGRA
ncbi:alcohol oxidase [Coniophora puteana RWD-64-598 SS2]|uniref:Alcohol oxidase n=1 Tax=Coniophora puteana (strain RWD-64-598) TaxID=741705 RepID=A0A5M3N585_CONPW|nr:alcohol oxidase [Coniophora puteana RWD-64-598 SS2]EIW86015.1 alcohol oxidase [Coniophora puteana RWD-64-598 SS2]